MNEYLPIVSIIISLITMLLSYVYRKSDKNDKQITELQEKIHKLNNKVHVNDISTATLIEKAENIKEKLDKIEDKLYE
jgi:hypothetical protein